MKKLGMIGCLVLATSLTAFADGPVLNIQSGSNSYTITNFVLDPNDPTNNTYKLGADVIETLANGQKFTLLASDTFIDLDPKVQYGVGVTNDENATGFTPYTFTYTTNTALAAGLYNVSATLSGSLTDGGANGSTLQPSSAFPYVQQSLIGTNDAGVDLLNSPVSKPSAGGASQGFTIPGASGTYNLLAPVTQISIQTNFALSDNDTATLSGRFDVNAVPEPSSVWLSALAATAFAGLVIRSRRNKQA